MQKVIINLAGFYQIYDIGPGQTAEEVAAGCGVTDPDLYQEFDASDFDPACYNFPAGFSLSEGVVSFSLLAAKNQAINIEKFNYATLESSATQGYSTTQLSSQASLPAVDRLPEVQSVLDAVNVLAVELNDKLIAINTATNIDELNNIVNPPTGILFTGRGSGLGSQDLNVSYYTEFNSVSLSEAETELYVPGTDIVIPFNPEIGDSGGFDSIGNCFTVGDYLIQIRETDTSLVIAELEVPLNPAGENISF